MIIEIFPFTIVSLIIYIIDIFKSSANILSLLLLNCLIGVWPNKISTVETYNKISKIKVPTINIS